MKLIVLSNLKDRFPAYARIVLMLTVMIFITSILMSNLLPLIHIRQAYKQLELRDSVVIASNNEKSGNIKAAVDICDGKYLGVSFRGRYTYDSFAYIQPVEKCYFTSLPYKFKTAPNYDGFEKLDSYPAVIASSLAEYYSVGDTCSERLSGKDSAEISFTVVGVLKNDFIYLTPAEDSPSSIISEQSNYIFVITDENDTMFAKRNLYGALANGNTTEFCNAVISTGTVENAFTTQGFEDYCALELEIIGLPIMLQIISTALCLAGIMSNSILSMVVFQRKYRILFTCGASVSQCRIIQIVTDSVPMATAIIVFAGLYISTLKFNVLSLNTESTITSLTILAFVFTAAETLAFAAAKSLDKR